MDKKTHWETVYQTKKPQDVSWTQPVPETSLKLIKACNLPKNAAIIDVGGGDSHLVDFLWQEGYTNLTVLDISESALIRAKERLGAAAENITWIVSDITEFKPPQPYALWHDRATFHFLTKPDQIETYVQTTTNTVSDFLILGTFSENGPTKCSGLEITQYSPATLPETFSAGFEKLECFTQDHTTPFGTTQNFLFCRFRKK